MTSSEIRRAFLDFFRDKQHKIVPSAPIVNKDDPSLLFTNAGMNQFKDYFLGDKVPANRRVADTQKCMRVSGKHNDLDDVGRDGTHHTMFEMLGNWSFGDYFKDEAIAWSWELLTERLGINKDQLYATVFEGAEDEGIPVDDEARNYWLRYLPEDRILYGNKKDNFWEMGETGPCGPCTEIHVDLRPEEARAKSPGRALVNVDGSGVVEIWNNVFIQYNRRADGSLVNLPERHVDTGMGFERLCMVLQGKTATYDTDIFTPTIAEIERLTGLAYGASYAPDTKADMAMRVVADHLRAVAFTIADGQLPGSSGAGYVVRRILRRAVRYAYSFLDRKEPFIYQLLPVLVREMGEAFPELARQQEQIARIVQSEERSFLQTIQRGLSYLNSSLIESFSDQLREHLVRMRYDPRWRAFSNTYTNDQLPIISVETQGNTYELAIVRSLDDTSEVNQAELLFEEPAVSKVLSIDASNNPIAHPSEWPEHRFELFSFYNNLMYSGSRAFEMYDTYGFPYDLTKVILDEIGWSIDQVGFESALQEQKDRSRQDAAKEVGDWIVLSPEPSVFIGYDVLSDAGAQVTKYRTVKVKDKPQYQLVLDRTPFYGESGGQTGDIGIIRVGEERLEVLDTVKENDLTVHIVNKLPSDPQAEVYAEVNAEDREKISAHHTGAHLLHAALREVLGEHAVQKGQDVRADKFRFDFSHFERPTEEELERVELLINRKIRQNIPLVEQRDVPIAEARNSGAMMLFGEKYGDRVRIITFDADFSSELCGGTHVPRTGDLGLFKITSESALAAGIRRIEAVAGLRAEWYVRGRLALLTSMREELKNSSDPVGAITSLQDENRSLKKSLEKLQASQASNLKGDLEAAFEQVGDVKFLAQQVDLSDAAAIKNLAFQLTGETDRAVVLLASESEGKALLTLAVSKGLAGTSEGAVHAGAMIKQLAKHIRGGGGGQPFFATAGGKEPGGIPAALRQARELVIGRE